VIFLFSLSVFSAQNENALSLLSRADSLVEAGKPVAALSLYRSVGETTLDQCMIAQSEVGKGRIQQTAGNLERAAKAWISVENNCSICPSEIRSELVYYTVEGWISQGEETMAMNLIDVEKTRNPDLKWESKLELLRARIYFLNGEWSKAREVSTPDYDNGDININRLILWVQSGVLDGMGIEESGIEYLNDLRKGVNIEIIDAAYANLHTLLVTEKRYSEALNWAKSMLLNSDPISSPEDWILGQIRIAKSAELSGKTLDALLAHHEAVRAAEILGDDNLTARTCRERSRFDAVRGDNKSAYIYLHKADSLALAMIAASDIGREPKSFKNHPLPELDPFDLASAKATKTTDPGAWPFAAALIALGLIAFIIRNFDLRRTLRRERLRTMRLHSMFGKKSNPDIGTLENETTEDLVEILETQFANSSEDWERRVNANALDFDDVIASLEMELGTVVEWGLENDTKAPEAPEGLLPLLLITLRRLLPIDLSQELVSPLKATIRNDWRGVRIMFEGAPSSATQELKDLFSGNSSSSIWAPVFEQAERMAGRVLLECSPSGGHSVVLDLPHSK
jgi:tetratricopeptide (TPR) repeat protein